MKSFKDFIAECVPKRNELQPDAPMEGLMFETYGPEFEAVQQARSAGLPTATLVEEDGERKIVPGMRLVNRLGHFLLTHELEGAVLC